MTAFDGTDVSLQGRWLYNGNPVQVCRAPIAFSCSRNENYPVRITIIAGVLCRDGSYIVSDSVIFECDNPNIQQVLEQLNHPVWVAEPLLAQFLLIANNFLCFVEEGIDTPVRYRACLEMLQGLGRQLDKDESQALDLIVGLVNDSLTQKVLARSSLSKAEQHLTQVWGFGLQAWRPEALAIFRSLLYPNGYGFSSVGVNLDGVSDNMTDVVSADINPTEALNRMVMNTSALYGSCYYALAARNPFKVNIAGLTVVGPPFRHYSTAVSLETGRWLGGSLDQTSLNFLTYRDLCSEPAALCDFPDERRSLTAFSNPSSDIAVTEAVRAPVHKRFKRLVEKLRKDCLTRVPDLSSLSSSGIAFIIPSVFAPTLSREALEYRLVFVANGLWLSVLHSTTPLEYNLVFFASNFKDNINCQFRFIDAWIIRALMASIWDSACDNGKIALFPNDKRKVGEFEDVATDQVFTLPYTFYLGWKYQNFIRDQAGVCLRLN